HGCRPIDGHAHRAHGIAKIESRIEFLGIVQTTDGNPGIPNFSMDVGAVVRVAPKEGDRIKGRGKSFGRHVNAYIMKPPVGPFGPALPGKHPGGVLPFPFEGVQARCKGKGSRNILLHGPLEDLPPSLVFWKGDLGNPAMGEGLGMGLYPDIPAPYLEMMGVRPVSGTKFPPL